MGAFIALRFSLALALANDMTPTTAERACGTAWEEDSDGWHSCVCSLETWRCTAQGWCDHDETAPYQRSVLAPPSVERVVWGCE